MGHTPYGYRIENGKAVIDEIAAEKVKKLYLGYLAGLSLNNATKEAEIKCYHAVAGKMLQNKHYLGDEFYPQIIDEETFEKANEERQKRAERLGRIREPKEEAKINYAVRFTVKTLEQKYDNPFRQAEYAYSLIESEV